MKKDTKLMYCTDGNDYEVLYLATNKADAESYAGEDRDSQVIDRMASTYIVCRVPFVAYDFFKSGTKPSDKG